MDRVYLEIFFLCGMVFQLILLVAFIRRFIVNNYWSYFNEHERQYSIFVLLGYQILPLIYIFSTWFSWFDYNLPKWFSFPVFALYCFGFWLFFKAHTELGPSWSANVEVHEGQKLITDGVFKWVRHPMYASIAAVAIAQVFMLQNWLVGPAFLITATPFYRYIVAREEKHLINHFGEQYLQYIRETNALFPKLDQINYAPILNKLVKFRIFLTKKFKR